MSMDAWTKAVLAMTFGIPVLLGAVAGAAELTPSTDYARVAERLDRAVAEQMAKYGIRGISVALVDDQRVVHAAGHGTARLDTVFRAGSISKVFNAVAIMQLVEQGKLDLDAPIRRFGPQFALVAPLDGAPPVTLRQILCHRSGMVRESPVGGYLDGSQPGLTATVASVRACPLINPPNTKTRYSNIAPSVAGEILVACTGTPYERYQREHLLGPLGMSSSSFVLEKALRPRLATSFMRIADGRGGFTRGEAPVFELGTLPAGNLYATAGDLAKFLAMLAAGGRAGGRQIISQKTLDQMSTPQLVQGETGFGLGFMVGKFRSHKSLGHMGAVYGHTASLVFLPKLKIGVVLLSNEDIASGPLRKLTHEALSLMVEAKLGEKPPAAPKTVALTPNELAPLAGEYESQSHWAKITVTPDGKLAGNLSTQPIELTPVGPLKFLADGRLFDASPIEFERDTQGKIVGFTAMEQKFTRVAPNASPDVPPLWAEYTGVYGPTFIPLVVSIRHGRLYATVENELDYRLIPASRSVFVLPPGMYWEEHLVFQTKPDGKIHGASFGNMYLRRH
jgi:CubicO group peptidase (beta-lactamase class C family)